MISSLTIEQGGDFFKSWADVFVCPIGLKNEPFNEIAGEFDNALTGFQTSYIEAMRKAKLDYAKPCLLWSVNPSWHDRMVMLFPIRYDSRNPADLEYIELSLATFCQQHRWHMLCHSWAFPAIGEEYGADWKEVKRIMVSYLREVNTQVIIYE